jgi:hypothetical protein
MTVDVQLLRTVLTLHAVGDPEILDVCANVGVMWRGLERHYRITRMDHELFPGLDLVGRWQDLPMLFLIRRFDVVAFDPPHLTQGGHGLVGNSRGYGARYSTFVGAPDLDGPNIGDIVRSNRRQWQPLEFILAARELGYTPCELVPLPLRGFPYDPKNIHQLHLRSRTYWIVLHAGPSCMGPGIGVARVCVAPGCGRGFHGRADPLTCSPRCGQRHRRAAAGRSATS